MHTLNLKDALGGAIFFALGTYFVFGSLQYDLGTTRNIGPGYYPLGLGLIAAGMGLLFLIRSLGRREPIARVAWRPLVMVLASIGAFGLVIERFGLVPAAFLSVCVASVGDPSTRLPQAALLGALIAALVWGVFVVGLGLTIPAFAWLL